MKEIYGIDSMPETAENVAEKFQITRQDQDIFAYNSQNKAAKAIENGSKQTVAKRKNFFELGFMGVVQRGSLVAELPVLELGLSWDKNLK